jgi:hypothetical protein
MGRSAGSRHYRGLPPGTVAGGRGWTQKQAAESGGGDSRSLFCRKSRGEIGECSVGGSKSDAWQQPPAKDISGGHNQIDSDRIR